MTTTEPSAEASPGARDLLRRLRAWTARGGYEIFSEHNAALEIDAFAAAAYRRGVEDAAQEIPRWRRDMAMNTKLAGTMR